MPTQRIDTVDPIVQRLHVLVESSPDLAEVAHIYERILPLLRDADLHVTPLVLTPAQARAKMERGLPLLHELDLEIDDQAICQLMLQLAHALETTGEKSLPPKRRMPWERASRQLDAAALYENAHKGNDGLLRAAATRQIRLALEGNQLNIGALLPHTATGDSGFVTAVAHSLQLDPGLLWTLVQNALKPTLRAWRQQLAPLAEGIAWHKGYCFVCGAGATLGELQGNDQVKHLRCGQCGADWLFRRLQCMYCGNQDHSTLDYLYVEGQPEKMRLEVCGQCHGYLKIIAAFAPTPADMLPVEDLATLHLDYIAQERGYSRVAVQ